MTIEIILTISLAANVLQAVVGIYLLRALRDLGNEERLRVERLTGRNRP